MTTDPYTGIVHCCLREVLTAKYRHVSLISITVRFIICARFGKLVAWQPVGSIGRAQVSPQRYGYLSSLNTLVACLCLYI
jgi:hypothetical protein